MLCPVQPRARWETKTVPYPEEPVTFYQDTPVYPGPDIFPSGSGMTRPRILQTPAALILFLLDTVLAVTAWPMVLWLARFDGGNPWDMRALTYPPANLLLLYAMGLYRREAIVEQRQAMARVLWVVAMGAVLALGFSVLPPRLAPGMAAHDFRDEMLVCALAVACFTVCASVARLVL